MIEPIYPRLAKNRGPVYWLLPANLAASRRKFKSDYSNEWRYVHEQRNPPASRTVQFQRLLEAPAAKLSFKFIIVGDTGEGDRSQYGLLPLIRAVEPDFMIINGDVAYPAGRYDDFIHGFFEPYQNFDIPVWATAGNHEYYSKHHGREFYDIFCTNIYQKEWARYGLRLVEQPGMFWELRDSGRSTGLVVIGLDSGKKANLDGHTSFVTRINPFARSKTADLEQHRWLEDRLTAADDRGDCVMILFHIPSLVSQEHKRDTHLGELHRIIGRHACVRAVICGHTHNHQQYEPTTFGSYLAAEHKAPRRAHQAPHYVVSGNGGATVDGTVFRKRNYSALKVFPEPSDWQEYTLGARSMIDRAGLDRSLLSRTLGIFKKSVQRDADAAKLLSFILVEVNGAAPVSVSHVWMKNLQDLFTKLPDGTPVDVTSANPPLDPDALTKHTTKLFDIC